MTATARLAERAARLDALLNAPRVASPPSRFGTQHTLTGFDVIDLGTGHAVVSTPGRSLHSANGIAQSLNSAAKAGPKALTVALGCADVYAD